MLLSHVASARHRGVRVRPGSQRHDKYPGLGGLHRLGFFSFSCVSVIVADVGHGFDAQCTHAGVCAALGRPEPLLPLRGPIVFMQWWRVQPLDVAGWMSGTGDCLDDASWSSAVENVADIGGSPGPLAAGLTPLANPGGVDTCKACSHARQCAAAGWLAVLDGAAQAAFGKRLMP